MRGRGKDVLSGENGVNVNSEVGKRASQERRIYTMSGGAVVNRVLEPECLSVNLPLTYCDLGQIT